MRSRTVQTMTTKRLVGEWLAIPALLALLMAAACIYRPTINVLPEVKTDLRWPVSQPAAEATR